MSSSLSPWKQCAVCKNPVRFQSAADFIKSFLGDPASTPQPNSTDTPTGIEVQQLQHIATGFPPSTKCHLRQYHCRREGGSFVCHYGTNGVCSSLPLEGVSDADYDRHVRTRHLVDVTGVDRSSETGFSRSSLPSSSRDSSPLQEPRWSLYDVSQNLPALLNDPSRRRQRDLFTKTWGEAFVPCSVADSPLLPVVSQSDFHAYSKMVAKRQLRRDGDKSSAGSKTRLSDQPFPSHSSSSALSDSRPDLSVVPDVWFDPKFDLRQQDTFTLICPDGVVCSRSSDAAALQHIETAKVTTRGRQRRASAKAQRPEFSLIDRTTHDQLTYYLDLVEMCIASQIADKSEAFFDAMSSHDALMKQLDRATRCVKTLRKSISTLRHSQLLNIAGVLRGQQLRINGCKLLQLLTLMRTLRHTQPTIQMLLSSTDYVGALDLIGTSQEVLQQELAGVQAFRHFSGQLNEMRALIDKMVTAEYVRLVAADLNRLLDDSSSAEQDTIVPVVFGMLRLCNVNLVDLYRDECYTATRAVVKQLAIESLAEAEGSASAATSVDNDDKQAEHDTNSLQLPLAENLSSDQWLYLLRRVCSSLITLLSRIKMFCNLLRSVLGSEDQAGAENSDGAGCGDGLSSLSLPLTHSLSPSMNGEVFDSVLTPEQHSRISEAVGQLPARLTEYMHEQSSSLLQMFMRSVGGGDVPQFLQLADIVEQFVARCRQVSGKRCSLLYATLQTQAGRFVQQFHSERRNKLTLLLDTERWRQTDVPAQFQAMIDHVTTTGEPGLLPVDLSEPTTTTAATSAPTRTRLKVLDAEYCVVGTVLMLLRLVFEYCDCARRLVSVTADILIKLTDLLRVYNSVSCRLVVGGGAVQHPSATLKTISLKNLALSGRSLQLILRLSPYIVKFFEKVLSDGHSSMKHLNQVFSDCGAHVAEIDAKLVNIVTDICDNQLNKWQAKPPVPSLCFRAICRAIGKLHESVSDVMETDVTRRLMNAVNVALMRSIRRHVTLRLKIDRDNGPQHGVVTSELVFYCQRLRQCGLDVKDSEITSMLWSDLSTAPTPASISQSPALSTTSATPSLSSSTTTWPILTSTSISANDSPTTKPTSSSTEAPPAIGQ